MNPNLYDTNTDTHSMDLNIKKILLKNKARLKTFKEVSKSKVIMKQTY